MSYDSDETSIQDGAPIELYEFDQDGTITRLTSCEEDVTWASNLYTALPGLSRSNIAPGTVGESREITITMPVDHALAQQLLGNGIPHEQIAVTISRIHPTAASARMIWRGYIESASTDEQWIRVRTARDVDDVFSIMLPVLKASRTCQHQLYDAGCKANTLAVLVEVADVDGLTIELDAAFTEADGWANGGTIVLPDGKRRTILVQVGTTITIDIPFRELAAETLVTVAAGCDHTVETCREKFDNVPNFGGHPQMPNSKVSAPNGYGVIVQA